jgi:acetylornithine deacetylase/succinyl-diaminopimelate desuccinylase-like protein
MHDLTPLINLLKIPSVSATHEHMNECAEKIRGSLSEAGCRTQIFPTEGHPIVYGEIKGTSDKCLLFYDHYDVQPPDPLEEWDSPPFSPQIRNNRLYARGAVDNKGNIMARIEAVKSFDELPITVKFLIEGEEEIGSPHLEPFVRGHASLLSSDGCIWEMGEKDEMKRPTIFLGVKGLCYIELTARGPLTDLHSAYAAIVENPAWRLIDALHTFKTKDKITIPGFHDSIRQLEKEEQEIIHTIPFDAEDTKKEIGISQFTRNMPGREAMSEILFGPTCNISGLKAGYTGEGSKTVLPSKAIAKIDFRLVPDQKPEAVVTAVKNHLSNQGFSDITVKCLGALNPARTSPNTRLVSVVQEAIFSVCHTPVVTYPSMAGSGPMWLFTDILHIPTVSTAIGDIEANIHSPNESIDLSDYEEGIEINREIINRF